jgi:molybdopterin converting factor small subunit
VGGKTVEIDAPADATVQTVVDAIVARFPPLAPALRGDDGRVPRGVHVFVNGRGAGYLPDGWATRLSEDDTLDVFPAVAGG